MTSVAEKIAKAWNNHTLDLSFHCINIETVKSIIQMLELGKLTHLYLSYSDSENTRAITYSLKYNNTLTHLDLQNTFNGGEGAKIIADLLEHNDTLTHINLSCNYMGVEGIMIIADSLKRNKTLTSLDLTSNYMYDEGSNIIAEAFRYNRKLTSVDLTNNGISDEGVEAITTALVDRNCIVKNIDWRHNDVGVDGARAIAKSLICDRTFQSINLSYNNIGDVGAMVIAEALEQNKNLTFLGLIYCSIGKEGAMKIAQALMHNTTLTSIHLSCNDIGDEGSKAIAEALRKNPTISDLDVDFRLNKVLFEELSPFERLVDDNNELLAHWRMIRGQCKSLILLGTLPVLGGGQQVNQSPLYQHLASDECYDINIFREIFEFSGDYGFGVV